MLAIKTGGHKPNEKRLFHGTSPDTVEAICKQNFDWRLHGKNATVYGEGSYFALNSSYSDAYAKEDANSYRFMFVAKVLVGSYTIGHSSYRRPPQKDPSNPASDLYDSCVDDRSDPTIFVVFDHDQFYPEYIIKYSQPSALYSVAPKASPSGYQQPVVRRPAPKPRVQAAASQPTASQAHATRASTSRSSSTSGTPVYSGGSGISSGYSSSSNTSGVSSYRTASGPYSGTSSGYSTSSASNTSSSPYHRATPVYSGGSGVSSGYSSGLNTARVSSYSTSGGQYSGASSGYNPSSASSTSSSPYQRTPSGPYTSSTRQHSTAGRSSPQHGSSTQFSYQPYRSSSKKESKCSVM